jgi:hypothetical protein
MNPVASGMTAHLSIGINSLSMLMSSSLLAVKKIKSHKNMLQEGRSRYESVWRVNLRPDITGVNQLRRQRDVIPSLSSVFRTFKLLEALVDDLIFSGEQKLDGGSLSCHLFTLLAWLTTAPTDSRGLSLGLLSQV